MNNRIFLVCLVVLLVAVGASLAADRVILKGGSEISGEVLKNDASGVVVDIGCAALRLARTDVVRVEKAETQPAGGTTTNPGATTKPSAGVEKAGTEWQLYRTAKLERDTIERNAQRYGEGVVMVTTPEGLGSGFILNPDGYLITNYHVIAGETRIQVTVFRRTATGYEQKRFRKIKIVAINPFVDLALLKIEDADGPLKYVYLGEMADVEAGQEVFAIGNPLGLTRTVSQGIVSSRNRNFEGQLYIQTTTSINPGNSGGPLFNSRGEVIGVTSMGYLYMGGLNFAIPIDVVRRFIENRDAFAYDEDNPNAGFRYLQPAGRQSRANPPAGRVPTVEG